MLSEIIEIIEKFIKSTNIMQTNIHIFIVISIPYYLDPVQHISGKILL
jgi:hypothetical protein